MLQYNGSMVNSNKWPWSDNVDVVGSVLCPESGEYILRCRILRKNILPLFLLMIFNWYLCHVILCLFIFLVFKWQFCHSNFFMCAWFPTRIFLFYISNAFSMSRNTYFSWSLFSFELFLTVRYHLLQRQLSTALSIFSIPFCVSTEKSAWRGILKDQALPPPPLLVARPLKKNNFFCGFPKRKIKIFL